ncbi:MAG: hypothetical protein JXM70_00965, partial [Pirellulales bacterium]|nr:hypothetical protein [Pirellulales bacterium]
IACLFASSPTSVSPLSLNATILGVSRYPVPRRDAILGGLCISSISPRFVNISLRLSVKGSLIRTTAADKQKKADVVKHPKVFDHAGLLVNEPPRLNRVALYLVIREFCWKMTVYYSFATTLPTLLLYAAE